MQTSEKIRFLSILLCTGFITFVSPAISLAQKVNLAGGEGFVVAELFTSQGCSSCPAADAELARLRKIAKEQGVRIYPVSYHVQYWDYLGWREPYGLAAGTARQREYANRLGTSVFTPQLILNGSKSIVGSQGTAVDRAVRELISVPADDSIQITKLESEGSALSVTVSYSANVNTATLLLLAIQHEVSNGVLSGENVGKTLSHVNVVRALVSARAEVAAGSTVISLQLHDKTDEIIVLLQETPVGKVLAVASRDM